MGLKEARVLEERVKRGSAKDSDLYGREVEKLIAGVVLTLMESGFATPGSTRTPKAVASLLLRAHKAPGVNKQTKSRIAFLKPHLQEILKSFRGSRS